MKRANELTISIVKFLNLSGFCCWRNYNGAVYSKKRDAYMKNPQHKLGIPDIIGYQKATGRFIGVEVKIGRDKLSQEQSLFIGDVVKAGGIALVAHDTFDDFQKKFQAFLALDDLKAAIKSA